MALDVKEWLKADEKTHGHNQKLLRKLFAEWAARKTSLGSLQEWERISAGSVPKSTKSPPHLFIDSTDFRRTGKKRTSKKSEKWSYKCNSPARRYMAITDASGRGRYISNGYSPKLYDAHWVQARQDWCERKLAGATVYADNHFYSAAKYLKQARLIASKKKPTKREMDIHDKLMNQNIASIRGRVESPFGIMESKFEQLSIPFSEDTEQQDYLVTFAFGVVSFEKINKK